MNAVVSTLDARRAEALEVFRAKGIPHRRVEEWKYSDLRSALAVNDVEQSAAAQWQIENTPAGVEVFDLATAGFSPDWVKRYLGAISEKAPMAGASLAFAHGGLAIRVLAGTAVAAPLRLAMTQPGQARLLIVLEQGASLTLLESQRAGGTGFRNLGAEISLGPKAKLTHVRIADAALDSVQVEDVAVKIAAGADYHAHFANFGAKLSRTELHIALEGEGAEAHLSGVSVLGDSAHADVTTHITHAAGNTRSTQLFKKLADGKSRAVYQGKITVAQGANGSDSVQTAKGLLLNERAEIDLKPELEIFADDVKCAHGAAVGDLDLESLFYLQSRGIPEAVARALLMRAFLGDAVDAIENEDIRASVWSSVESALEKLL